MVVEFSLFDNRSVCRYNIKIGDNVILDIVSDIIKVDGVTVTCEINVAGGVLLRIKTKGC